MTDLAGSSWEASLTKDQIEGWVKRQSFCFAGEKNAEDFVFCMGSATIKEKQLECPAKAVLFIVKHEHGD